MFGKRKRFEPYLAVVCVCCTAWRAPDQNADAAW